MGDLELEMGNLACGFKNRKALLSKSMGPSDLEIEKSLEPAEFFPRLPVDYHVLDEL